MAWHAPKKTKKSPKKAAYSIELLRQVPYGHILGPTRMALMTSPCCGRRLRVPLIREKAGWRMRWAGRRCPNCRYIWQLTVKITSHGFVSRAFFVKPHYTRSKS